MNEFLNVAKSLEIKEISKDVDCDLPDAPNDQQCDENSKPIFDNTLEETTIERQSNDKLEIMHPNSKVQT